MLFITCSEEEGKKLTRQATRRLCSHKIVAVEPLDPVTRMAIVKTTGREVKGTRVDRNADKLWVRKKK